MIGIDDLPVAAVRDQVAAALATPGSRAVLVAPPGAGKTTAVPLWVLALDGVRRIAMTEPRRVAARAAATRIAALAGEPVGATIGYRTRDETRVSGATRIEVLTSGVLTQMLQHDPTLGDFDAVILDECHERSVEGDLNTAFALDAAAQVRPDLRLVAMSATIDGSAVAALLDAQVIAAELRPHPVDVHYLREPALDRGFDAALVAELTRAAHRASDGAVLVFVPGVHEINKVRELVADLAPLALHGNLSLDQQHQVLNPPNDLSRRVIVATSIAETSVTIPDVRAVVDSGWSRVARYDPRRAIGGLATVRVSRAGADQRAGRAGRVGPGCAWRAWSAAEHERLAPSPPPEILATDPVPLAFELCRWGDPGGATLRWLDAPPPSALTAAHDELYRLGLVDRAHRLTPHGRECAALPVHPRLAHALVRSRELGFGATACAVVAHLSEPRRRNRDRIELGGEALAESRDARRLRELLGIRDTDRSSIDQGAIGAVVALAYPDRVGRRRAGGRGRYQLVSGAGARIEPTDRLAGSEWLAIAELTAPAGGGDNTVRAAAALDDATVTGILGELISEHDVGEWDPRTRDAVVARETRVGEIVLRRVPLDDIPTAQAALLDGIRAEGLALLARWPATAALRDRLAFLRRGDAAWPDVSEAVLMAGLAEWLGPYLGAARRRADLARVDVAAAILGLLSPAQRRALAEHAPESVTLANGRRVMVSYLGDRPQISMRIQHLLGVDTHPMLPGDQALLIELLSPANRPVQVTADLPGFWRGSYRDVRKELRGRYPKHAWPEDPTRAATA